MLFLRHTSASLVIEENADADVRTDLVAALRRLAPADAGWVHQTEGPDDMPAHIKSMLNGVCLHVPVGGGQLRLGTWQGIYVAEHRQRRTGARSCCSFSARAKKNKMASVIPPSGAEMS